MKFQAEREDRSKRNKICRQSKQCPVAVMGSLFLAETEFDSGGKERAMEGNRKELNWEGQKGKREEEKQAWHEGWVRSSCALGTVVHKSELTESTAAAVI